MEDFFALVSEYPFESIGMVGLFVLVTCVIVGVNKDQDDGPWIEPPCDCMGSGGCY